MKYLAILVTSLVAFHGVVMGSATDYWITQSGAGTANGSSLSNAASCGGPGQSGCSSFNNAANWGSGSGQIGSATTVHFSGSFVAAAGANPYLKAQGAVGTIRLESGTGFTAPYFTQWLNLDGSANVTVQGSGTGICGWINGAEVACTEYIQNTLNGTSGYACPGGSCTYQQSSFPIHAYTCNGCTFHDLGFYDIYDKNPSTLTDENTQSFCISVEGVSVSIYNNFAHDMNWCFANVSPGSSTPASGSMYNNVVYNTNHAYVMGAEGSGASIATSSIYNNECRDMANWDDAMDLNHHDCVHVYADTGGSGGSASNVNIYNNYLHGAFGALTNSALYTEGSISYFNIFNNLIAPTSYSNLGGGLLETYADSTGSGCNNLSYLNNTINAPGGGSNIGTGIFVGTFETTYYCTNVTIENNIIYAPVFSYIITGTETTGSSNYNLFYDSPSGDQFQWMGVFYSTLTTYRSATMQDTNSLNTAPNLSGSYTPNPGSPLIGAGTNLTSLMITALDSDASGNARPSSGAWTIGAYNYISAVFKGISSSTGISAGNAVQQ